MNGTIYDICLELAKQSPCQKRGFGCVLVYSGSIVARTNNHDIDDISQLCKPTCIRFKMQSGSDPMIGDCGHAEEHAIWECIRQKGTAEGAVLYIVGVTKPDNKPLENPKFYCVRCSTLMRYADISSVNTWANNKWNEHTPQQAYETSLEYALPEEFKK